MSDVPTVVEQEPPPPAPANDPRGRRSRSLAAWTFGVYVAISLPVLLFGLGSYRWFFRDDWYFIAGRGAGSLSDVFEPSNGHWTTVPLLWFRALYSVFGMHTYLPYMAVVVVLHLVAAVLVRWVMRRSGVRPWLATVAAAPFVLFGPGSENIIWAFQIGFTGAVVFGLVHVILADHDGRFDWRDWLGLAAGVLSLASAGVGTIMIGVVGVSVLLRRGWRLALAHTVPLALVYVAYLAAERPDLDPVGRPTLRTLWDWAKSAEIGTFLAIGHWPLLAFLLLVVLVAGAVLAVKDQGRRVLRRASLPIGLVLGGAAFAISTGQGRWIFGEEAARAGRYVHIGAAFTLPALAFAAEVLVRRRRVLLPAFAVLFLLPMPWYMSEFKSPIFLNDERILTAAVEVPFARDVPGTSHPNPDAFLEAVTMDFLFTADRDGKLPEAQLPLSARTVNDLRLRLGLAQSRDGQRPANCRRGDALDASPQKGTVFRITEPVRVVLDDGTRNVSSAVAFDPNNGRTLTVQLDGLRLRFTPKRGSDSFTICD